MATIKEGMAWFKKNFTAQIKAGAAGTPFTVDMLTAIAVQETFEVWGRAFKTMSVPDILAICVGDIIDAPGRKAFPVSRAALEAVPNGTTMFRIGRQALVDMAEVATEYQKFLTNPNKFCRGYGIFQFDLQSFTSEPDYFLQKKWAKFPDTLGKAVQELTAKQKKIHLGGKPTLTDMEMAAVAIAYNAGSFDPAKALKQGHFDGKRFYGENFFDFLQLAKTVPEPAVVPAAPAGLAGAAPVVGPPLDITPT
jgi:hypothetical protein